MSNIFLSSSYLELIGLKVQGFFALSLLSGERDFILRSCSGGSIIL